MKKWDWQSLREWIKNQAPVLIAGGDIREIKDEFELNKEADLSGMDYAISLALPLPRECLAGISDAPTLLYKHAYSQVNYLMDRTALGLALRLQEEGFRALAVPASQIIDWARLLGHVNHRQVAAHLGQGWFGRNNLLVTPDRGAQVRLVTVLTDAEITDPGPWADRAGESGCAECERCAPACPAGAIHTGPEDFDRPACSEKVREFEKIRGIGQRICGLCVKACSGPPGRAT
jgi:epoxyqueuosine reductase QueG